MKLNLTPLKDIFIKSFSVSMELFKIMIPILILVKLLKELGMIGYLALPLKPIMGLVGLPAEMGLVWATAILTNMYSGIVVFLSLVQDHPVNTAQATIMGVLLLIAHGLPVESGIARKAGPKFIFQCIARIVGALSLGMILNYVYKTTGTLQEPAKILIQPQAEQAVDPTLMQWALNEVQNLGYLYLIILGLLIMMYLLEISGLIELLNKLLRPVLKLIGIGPKASAITVIGLTLGLSYGGGLIIHESQSGNVDRKDVFYSLTLMGLCHSIVEDTLLMIMIGGHVSGLLWGRLLFSLVAIAILVKICTKLPAKFTDNFLWGRPMQTVSKNEV
ncbi:MAG: hypothetical protein ACNI27_04600 [Desulfovibrio sp.]